MTPRENELLALVCGDGLSIKEAAFQLKLAPTSARTYLQRIYRKLGVCTRWELERAYFSLGQSAPTSPDSSQGLVARCSERLDDDILPGQESEANAASRPCSQPLQKSCEMSGQETSLWKSLTCG